MQPGKALLDEVMSEEARKVWGEVIDDLKKGCELIRARAEGGAVVGGKKRKDEGEGGEGGEGMERDGGEGACQDSTLLRLLKGGKQPEENLVFGLAEKLGDRMETEGEAVAVDCRGVECWACVWFFAFIPWTSRVRECEWLSRCFKIFMGVP